jgi:hypothetical protein
MASTADIMGPPILRGFDQFGAELARGFLARKQADTARGEREAELARQEREQAAAIARRQREMLGGVIDDTTGLLLGQSKTTGAGGLRAPPALPGLTPPAAPGAASVAGTAPAMAAPQAEPSRTQQVMSLRRSPDFREVATQNALARGVPQSMIDEVFAQFGMDMPAGELGPVVGAPAPTAAAPAAGPAPVGTPAAAAEAGPVPRENFLDAQPRGSAEAVFDTATSFSQMSQLGRTGPVANAARAIARAPAAAPAAAGFLATRFPVLSKFLSRANPLLAIAGGAKDAYDLGSQMVEQGTVLPVAADGTMSAGIGDFASQIMGVPAPTAGDVGDLGLPNSVMAWANKAPIQGTQARQSVQGEGIITSRMGPGSAPARTDRAARGQQIEAAQAAVGQARVPPAMRDRAMLMANERVAYIDSLDTLGPRARQLALQALIRELTAEFGAGAEGADDAVDR